MKSKNNISPVTIMLCTYIPCTLVCIIVMTSYSLFGVFLLGFMLLTMHPYMEHVYLPLEELKDKEDELILLRYHYDILNTRYSYLQVKNDILRKELMNNKKSIDPSADVLEAIKYARNKSHPDNGGRQEDFIKFNNLYNKMK